MDKKIEIEKDIKRLVDFIIQSISPEKIYLFGSYAKGNPNEDSDIDFFIIKKTNLAKHKRTQILYRNDARFTASKKSVDFIIYTPDEFSVWSKYQNSIAGEVLETGKLLYER